MQILILLCLTLLQTVFTDLSGVCPACNRARIETAERHPFPQEKKLVLVVGCPRSGTQYINQVLEASGLQTGHEFQVKNDGIVSWLFTANSAKPAWGPPPIKYQFEHTFHQVRHPLKSIAALHMIKERSWNYIYREVPQIKRDEPILVRAAKMWIFWNEMGERRAEMTYRVEALKEALPQLSRRLKVPLDPAALKGISTKIDSSHHNIVVTWQDLKKALPPQLYKRLVYQAQRYGYDVNRGLALIP